jgi:hypothetical protein
MDQAHQNFGAEWAKAVTAKDFEKAHAMLASWLRNELSPTELKALLDGARQDLPEPARFELDSNSSTFEDLKEPEGYAPRSKPFDPGLTAENFRKWLCIEFKPTEDSEFDACFDLWITIVEENGRLAVGYLEATDAD